MSIDEANRRIQEAIELPRDEPFVGLAVGEPRSGRQYMFRGPSAMQPCQ